MPDILIRGMEMPKTCADCHDADLPTAIAWLGAKCPWANGIIDPGFYDLRHNRHPDCPLHELPPHGDLIDRDAVIDDLKLLARHECDWRESAILGVVSTLKSKSAVVPAERRDES